MAQTLFMNRRGTEPYARWCERTGEVTPLPTRFQHDGIREEGCIFIYSLNLFGSSSY